jgi:hypothetical protein
MTATFYCEHRPAERVCVNLLKTILFMALEIYKMMADFAHKSNQSNCSGARSPASSAGGPPQWIDSDRTRASAAGASEFWRILLTWWWRLLLLQVARVAIQVLTATATTTSGRPTLASAGPSRVERVRRIPVAIFNQTLNWNSARHSVWLAGAPRPQIMKIN